MLPVADAIRTERARARSEHREPRPILPGAWQRSLLPASREVVRRPCGSRPVGGGRPWHTHPRPAR
jgi:hypothetical protein